MTAGAGAGLDSRFWRNLFGRLQTDAGYTPAQIRDLTFDEVERLFEYWQTYPPVRDLVAAAVGYKPPVSSDLPPDSFERAKAATESWFTNPGRFFTADDVRRLVAGAAKGQS